MKRQVKKKAELLHILIRNSQAFGPFIRAFLVNFMAQCDPLPDHLVGSNFYDFIKIVSSIWVLFVAASKLPSAKV